MPSESEAMGHMTSKETHTLCVISHFTFYSELFPPFLDTLLARIGGRYSTQVFIYVCEHIGSLTRHQSTARHTVTRDRFPFVLFA